MIGVMIERPVQLVNSFKSRLNQSCFLKIENALLTER